MTGKLFQASVFFQLNPKNIIKNKNMFDLKKIFKPKKMQTNSKQRKIDQSVSRTTQNLGSQFALMSRREIAAWKAYLTVFFVGGFFAALIFGSFNQWYVGIKADNPPVIMSIITDTDARKNGDQYTDHILLDTGTKAVVAVQAIVTYDKAKVQIVSIDATTSDFPYEVKKEDDNGNGKIFIALGKPTPGVNSVTAKVVDINVKALADFSGSALTPKFDSAAAVDDSAAIEDDGSGTNILTQVKNVVTSPTSTDTTPPIISGGSPTGTLASGTTTTTLRVLTNENATCKYDTSSTEAYGAMSDNFSTTGAKNHTTSLSGLSDGNSYNYYIRCKDSAENKSTSSYKVSFSVSSGGSTSGTGPVIKKSAPSGELNADTSSITLKVATDVVSTCKYSTVAGTDYNSMTSTFSKTNALTSTTNYSGLTNGTGYDIYVRCKDGGNVVNTSDYKISFSVAGTESADSTPPKMSDPSPKDALSASTTSATLSIKTDEAATCKYGTSSLQYSRLPNTFSTTGGTDHSSPVDVTSGQIYKYYVRCQDTAGNSTTGFVLIQFSVE
jgi:hypothetical protein